MRAAYLTDVERAGITIRDLFIAAGVTTLVLMVIAGLVASSHSQGLRALVMPDPLSHAAELSAEQPVAEEVTRYVLDENAEYVGF